MSSQTHITQAMISKFQKDFNKIPTRHVVKNSIIKNGIKNATMNNNSIIEMQHTFSEEIKTGKATSQKNTGRCWMFAGLNTFRQKISKDLKIKDFELSQTYPMFWDKLEKSNYFLENIINTAAEDIYSRIIMWLLSSPIDDGGQWEMFANLIKKYGVVPKYVMPETFHSSRSFFMNKLITLKLREYASVLRKYFQNGEDIEQLRKRKTKMMNEIYRLLVFFLGEPPKKFDFEYRDEDKNFHSDLNLTPHSFYKKYVKLNLNDYVSIINAPMSDKPFNQTYSVKYLGNVIGGEDILYLNVEKDIMKHLALTQLKDTKPVWFGCDVSKMMDSKNGIMDTDLFLYEAALETKFNLNKAERLEYGESLLTHAMVFTGVNIVDDRSNRWKVENSWSEKSGNEGYYVMSDEWFDEFNYQVVIERKYLTEDLQEAAKKKPTVLPPWDPMGSLALMK